MKTIEERIKLEKRFWLDLFTVIQKSGHHPEWETISHLTSRQKVWNRLANSHHHKEQSGFYGLSFNIGRIGSHELRFCIEMQDELKIGLRFSTGMMYWTEEEIETWEELTLRLEGSGVKWDFDQPGWFVFKKLPVILNFRSITNSAALDLSYYQADSYARILIIDDIFNRISDIRSASYSPKTKKVWSLC